MGVPALYRWLVEKYPLAVEVVEEPIVLKGVKRAQPTVLEGVKYDNLYLDITAILYLSLHPQDRRSPYTYNEVLEGLFDYIDRIFALVRPQKLVYMAFDGVAPRAKMNEQRCRRFRAAKTAADSAAEEEKLREEFERQGKKLPPKNYRGDYFSHLIAPGTEFLATVSTALKYYIRLKLNYDTEWKKLTVIFSDANVPGEGEHKIMSYIRFQRNLPGYDPNTRHCVYGLDADLIMLALATHEVHFSILRNLVPSDCIGKEKEMIGDGQVVDARKQYQFLHVWRLREYLEYEMSIPNVWIRIDFERFIDDFILMCFFLGNDFLPRMPTLEIREDAINLLLTVYKKEFMVLGDYLTNSSRPNLKSVERFIQVVGSYEDNIFKKRAQLTQRQVEEVIREKAQITGQLSQPKAQSESTTDASHPISGGGAIIRFENSPKSEIYENKNDLKRKLKELLREKSDTFNSDWLKEDKVKLGEPGWKSRYYEQKFFARTLREVYTVRKAVVAKYIEGLCWTAHYYFEGICSWKWFYPYHYAPFASDLKDLGQLNISFELGSPFKPFTQMLGISAAANSRALPKEYRRLIIDPNSPIIDLYPTDFEVDTNGKRYTWQGVAKLPFIDEDRILTEVAKLEPTLTDEEVQRNNVTHEILFVSSAHKLYPYLAYLQNLYVLQITNQGQGNILERLDPRVSFGINGYISISTGEVWSQTFKSPIQGKEDIQNDQVICASYQLPQAHKHITRPHMGVIFPKRTVTIKDVKLESLLWHEEDTGMPLEQEGQSNNLQKMEGVDNLNKSS